MNSLVVYFSREGWSTVDFEKTFIAKGNTHQLAEIIADKTNSMVYRLVETVPYPEQFEDCNDRARDESERNAKVEYQDKLDSIADFDVIFVGFPIWYSSFPRIVATFLKDYDFSGKTIVPFCTNEEGRFGLAEMELKSLFKDKNVKLIDGLAIKGHYVLKSIDTIDYWLDKVNKEINK